MRKEPLVENEYYHVYNRGVDKRLIFSNEKDVRRFLQSMIEFNTKEPIGSIYENSFRKSNKNFHQLGHRMSKLVEIVAYCLNPNHYHFILLQTADKGIEKFMQRLGNGYTKYFNEKEKRSGVLFQGKFKSAHVSSNEYLIHLSVYVNLNDKVHQLRHPMSKLVRSSFAEYENENNTTGFCQKNIVLNQFKSRKAYAIFAKDTLKEITRRRKEDKNLEKLLLE